jgi:XTP/dITP diphosphohydrolase
MPKLLLATTNPGKTSEYLYLLEGLPFDIVTPIDENIDYKVDEKGKSYEDNARRKATEYASISGLITLADDSGIEVDALGGEPGTYSARYAGENASDSDRIEYLLAKLKEVPWEKRTARFKCVIAIALPKGKVEICTGECDGIIAFEAKGGKGFGYDPIFYIPELDNTMAALPPVIKNKISHRAVAAQKAYHILEQFAEKTKS